MGERNKRRSSRQMKVMSKADAMTKLSTVEVSLDLEQWVFLLTGSISFAIYLSTVAPGIVGGDSGELVAEGCQLGTAHPPGYPLYTVLVYIATNIGRIIGSLSPAYCVNITSCLFGALTSSFIATSVYNIANVAGNRGVCTGCNTTDTTLLRREWSVICSIATGVSYAISPLAHQYSVTAEVFAMHNFFVGFIVYTAIKFGIHGSVRLFIRGAVLCGLALTNQHTSILLDIPVILWVFHLTQLYRPKMWQQHLKQGHHHGLRLIVMAGASFLVAFLSLYATLPLFSFLYPHAGSWGDLESLQGFFNHIGRKDYGSFRLFSGNDDGAEDLWLRMSYWVKDFVTVQGRNLCILLTTVAVLAGWSMILRRSLPAHKKAMKKGKTEPIEPTREGSLILLPPEKRVSICAMLSFCLAFYLLVFHSLSNLPLQSPLYFGIHQRFWMHPNILAFILCGVCMIRVSSGLVSTSSSVIATSISRSFMFCVCLLMVIFCRRAVLNNNESDNAIFQGYASSILKSLPANSLLFTNYDQQWTSIRYLQECEQLRSDITSINMSMMSYKWWEKKVKLYPHVKFPGTHYTMGNTVSWKNGGFTFSELIDANYHDFNGKIFIGGQMSYQDPAYHTDYEEIPHGIVRRIAAKDDRMIVREAESYRKKSGVVWDVVMKETSLPDSDRYDDSTWESTVRIEFFAHFVSRANHLLDLAVSDESWREDNVLASIVESCVWLEIAMLNDISTHDRAAAWKNLGLAYMAMVKTSEESLPKVKNILNQHQDVLDARDLDPFWVAYMRGGWRRNDMEGFKNHASERWEVSWKTFLKHKDAKSDPSYYQVKKIYDQVTRNARKQ